MLREARQHPRKEHHVLGERLGRQQLQRSLSVDDDGHALLLRPMGIAMMSSVGRENLSQYGAAEYLWAILMRPLQ
jgi:hypothetical protein